MANHVSKSVLQMTMTGLGQVVRDIDPDDPRIFGYMEAYASLWLLGLEDDTAPNLDAGAAARVVPFPKEGSRARSIRARAPSLAH